MLNAYLCIYATMYDAFAQIHRATRAMPCYTMPCRAMPCHAVPCRALPPIQPSLPRLATPSPRRRTNAPTQVRRLREDRWRDGGS